MVTELAANLIGACTGAILGSLFELLLDLTVPKLNKFLEKTKLNLDRLQELKTLLLTVNKVLADAEEKQITNHSVGTWLDNLQDVAYDAEDLLDAIASEVRQSKLLKGKDLTKDRTRNPQIKNFNGHLEIIVNKLKNSIVEQIGVLGLKEGHHGAGGRSFPRLPTTSLVDKSEVCLREAEKMKILNFLTADEESSKGIAVVAVVGFGGIGKTALAQFLYNDNRVKEHFKDLRAWAYVSEDFDVFKVTKTIYESTRLSHSGSIEDLNLLQLTLKRQLHGRKFLLVLDDVWDVSSSQWDLLLRPLQCGLPGSKIIVTTRSQRVSSIIHAEFVRHLKPLPDEVCLQLFEKHAFRFRVRGERGDPILKEIGEKIVEKCKGFPLAAKTLGGILSSEVEADEWYRVLNSKIWDLPDDKSDILPALRLSYHHLPSHLKRCFAYCSLFPKKYKFQKKKLVRLWIAEGLVQRPARNGTRSVEEIGELYIEELISRSIFGQSSAEKGSFIIMHDLVNDLAQHVAGEFCFKLEDDSPPPIPNPERVRHLSFRVTKGDSRELDNLRGSKALRTFLPLRSDDISKAPFNNLLFKRLTGESSFLRVLSLSSYLITDTELPRDTIRNFKYLRYLELAETQIESLDGVCSSLYNLEHLDMKRTALKKLPDSIGDLRQLHYLDLSGTEIDSLPNSIGGLKQLGYLDLSCTKITFLPERLGSLYNLETLKLSRCCSRIQLPTDMKGLTKLKHLDIMGTPLEMLPDSIGDLRQLGYLDLSDTEITLLPNSIGDLTELAYLDLSGTKISFLPGSACSLYNLEKLMLSRCPQLEHLPEKMKDLTKLKHLDIKDSPIREMPPKFGNLKRLQLLTNFVVGNNRDGSSSSISEIENLSLLFGTISFSQLQKVSQIEDVAKANLKDKKYIRELILEWSDVPLLLDQNGDAQNAGTDHQNVSNGSEQAADHQNVSNGSKQAADDQNVPDGSEEAADHQNNVAVSPPPPPEDNIGNAQAQHATEVLDNLQPSENLEELTIIKFCGISFPRWLRNASLSKMKFLTLSNCKTRNSLLQLGELLSLEELTIHELAGVEKLELDFCGDRVAFPSLKSLHFQGMQNWEQWETSLENDGSNSFRSLEKLIIVNCPKLTGQLPTHLPSLRLLHIHMCDELRSLHTYSQLQHIFIRSCKKLACISKTTLDSFKNLEDRDIDDNLLCD